MLRLSEAFLSMCVACLALAVLASGCGSSSSEGAEVGACTDPACSSLADGCPEGLARDAATGACMDVSPEGECAPGTGAFLGATACAPVGWATCASPFETDPSGWGCRPVIAATCPAGTIGLLGSTTCTPVGDCDAPFPPPDATLFVDAALGTTDATHFTSLFEAAQSANAGAVIAVAPGRYVEDVDVMRSNISIVGKCAAQVILTNPGDKRAGILVTGGAKNVRVRGVTLTGHYTGILVKAGSQARLEDSLVLDNRYLGAYAAENGSRLQVVRSRIDDVVAGDGDRFGWGAAAQLGGAIELEDVVIDAPTGDGIVIGGAGSTGKLTRVVVRAPRLGSSDFATALGVVDGGVAEVDGALFEDLRTVGVTVSGGKAKVRHLVVRRTAASLPETGRGVQVSSGGELDLEESLITGSEDANLLVVGASARAVVASSVFLGGAQGDAQHGLRGVRVAGGASLDLSSSAIVDSVDAGLSMQDAGSRVTADHILIRGSRARVGGPDPGVRGVGISVTWGSRLLLSHGSVEDNHAAGILVSQTDPAGVAPHADVKSTLIRRSRPDAAGFAGRGIEVSSSASAALDGCALVENNEESVLVGRSGSVDIARTLIRDTRRAAGTFGHGVVVADSGTMRMTEAWLLGHPAIAVAVADGEATIERSLIARSAVGIAVAGATSLETVERVPETPPSRACVVSNDTRFVDNQTRVGSGAVPLPTPLRDVPGPIRNP